MEEIKTEGSQENQRFSEESIRSLLEALLFLSGEPLLLSSVKRIVDLSEDDFKRIMSELMTEYNKREG
ncbi:MAG: SMC-Scp complex subunit ScpB, partial [Thermodesulfovibrionales bacterium]